MFIMILIYFLVYIISLILSFVWNNFIFMFLDILIYCFIFGIMIKEDTNLHFNIIVQEFSGLLKLVMNCTLRGSIWISL